jgi:hypothetical protein
VKHEITPEIDETAAAQSKSSSGHQRQ